ncbi:MAG: hypothetical protein WCC25_16755, partial [Candidatus Korobacteraceae bacterium]
MIGVPGGTVETSPVEFVVDCCPAEVPGTCPAAAAGLARNGGEAVFGLGAAGSVARPLAPG